MLDEHYIAVVHSNPIQTDVAGSETYSFSLVQQLLSCTVLLETQS